MIEVEPKDVEQILSAVAWQMAKAGYSRKRCREIIEDAHDSWATHENYWVETTGKPFRPR